QRAEIIDRVQVRARKPVGLALVEIAAQTQVPVGEGKQRLGLRQHVQVQLSFTNPPGILAEGRMADHWHGSNSDRSSTTISAPRRSSASRWPVRSTPTTNPNWPARPASTPARASSK